MSSSITTLAADATLLRALQQSTMYALGITSGISLSLYVWIVPILKKAPSTRARIEQFNVMIDKGMQYLLPGSKIMATALAALAFLTSRHPNPDIARRWKYYGLAFACLASTGPYEDYFIFPINDKMAELGKKLEPTMNNFEGQKDAEVDLLLDKWTKRHVGRIMTTTSAFLIALWGVVAEQSM